MATNKQTRANRENALLGGVKTDEGKSISRLNALKHGFFSRIVTQYDKLNHKEKTDAIQALFSPSDVYTAQLVEILLSNLLAYRRICLIETHLTRSEFEKALKSEDFTLNDTAYRRRFRYELLDELLKFQRYKTSAFNLIIRAERELERLREAHDRGPACIGGNDEP